MYRRTTCAQRAFQVEWMCGFVDVPLLFRSVGEFWIGRRTGQWPPDVTFVICRAIEHHRSAETQPRRVREREQARNCKKWFSYVLTNWLWTTWHIKNRVVWAPSHSRTLSRVQKWGSPQSKHLQKSTCKWMYARYRTDRELFIFALLKLECKFIL